MEAVERLAAEAGLEVPKPSPEAAEAERRAAATSARCCDAAQASYHRRLFLPEGRQALAYLHGRGLTERDDPPLRPRLVRRGQGRAGRRTAAAKGSPRTSSSTPGLMRRDDETGRAFDLFFNRVMFPIRDRRGRVISFGGRILGDGQPKYVNGPETALFSKRRTLYALDLAREAVRGGAPLVVVEGYMDVIALAPGRHRRRRRPARHRADRGAARGAVAARAGADPVLRRRCRRQPRRGARGRTGAAAAGARAHACGSRRLPAGEDPDTLVRRRRGRRPCSAVLDAATPLAEALYDLLREAGGEATPEQRAAFRARLERRPRAHSRPGAGRRVSPSAAGPLLTLAGAEPARAAGAQSRAVRRRLRPGRAGRR